MDSDTRVAHPSSARRGTIRPDNLWPNNADRSSLRSTGPVFDKLSLWLGLLLSCRLRLLLGRGMRMIRNRLDHRLIHRLCACFRERGASGYDPVFRAHGSGAASASLDTAGIDSQLSFATGEIRLRIDGTFRRQVRALLGRFGIADDDQFILCILLQVLGYVVELAFALVVHAPRLLDLRHVREVAIRELAGLRRRRWRILNRHRRRGLRIEPARIGTSRAD